MSKKVAIILAYLYNNLGDDIFVQILCRRYPDINFYVATPGKMSSSLAKLPNLHFSKKMKEFDSQFGANEVSEKAKKYFKKFDACVAIGGSVFMQNSNMWSQVTRFKNRLELSNRLYVIGANFGPFNDNAFLSAYDRLFKKTTDICFRDIDSVAYFPDVDSIRYAPDVVFTYGDVLAEEKNKIIISIIDCAWAGRPAQQQIRLKKSINEYEKLVFDACKAFSEKGLEVCLMSFCEPQGDDVAAKRIQEKCVEQGIERVRVFSYDGDIEAAINEIATSKYVIATRFHSMILGWLFNKPTFPIIYDNKQRTVIKDAGFLNSYCYLTEVSNISAQDIVESLQNYREFDCKAYASEAENQFKGLDNFLRGEKHVRK